MNKRPWLKNYDEGVPHTIDYLDFPIHELIERAAEKYPDKACTIFNRAVITYSEMNEFTDRLAAGLHSEGIRKGDRVGLFIPNTPQFVMAYFALMKLGAVVVATNPLYTQREIIHQVNDAGVEYMILMCNYYEKVKEIQDQTGIKKIIATNIKETLRPFTRILFTLLKEKKAGFRITLRDEDVWMMDLAGQFTAADRPKVEINSDDTALFQYSGGTTGISKGVVAPHRGLIANTQQIKSWYVDGKEGEEVILLAIPLYHAYGMVVGLIYGVMTGATMVLVPDPRNVPDVLENIQRHKATMFPGVPALYNAINNSPEIAAGKYDISSIGFCLSGSAALLRETKERFDALTGGSLVEGYGLSEAPVAAHCNPIKGENRTGSIGLPLPDVECRIVDVDDGVTEMPIGEQGELIIKGPMVMTEYYNMPDETANAIRNGWLYTGDIVYMDKDGYFYIKDRKKEMIKSSGFQVWPREVEEIIIAHPKVFEVGVAGIPDKISGEAVKAWVVLKEGKTVQEDEIQNWCKEQLTGYKVPKSVVFLDEIPKSNVGKILRRELVRMHNENGQ